jgi:predicted nucleic acid-binding protein
MSEQKHFAICINNGEYAGTLELRKVYEVLDDANAEQRSGKSALGFTDCLVLEIARKAGHVPLGTFDKNLSKLDGTARV